MGGFSLAELGAKGADRLWLRGGLPPSYLARSEADSRAWRKNLVQTLLERDFPQWGVRVPAVALLRFWTMLAHYHGQTWNAAEPARAMGVSESTARRHLDLLTDAFVVRQLHPWHANIAKRQVKAPKIYIRDTGLLHYLLGIGTQKDLLRHPKVGASWEGFVIEQLLLTEPHDEVYFWATHQGAEIDLVLRRGGKLLGVECKRHRLATHDTVHSHCCRGPGAIRRLQCFTRIEAVRDLGSGGSRSSRISIEAHPFRKEKVVSEYTYVEKPFLDQLAGLGWKVIDHGQGAIPSDPAVSLRSTFRELILPEVFNSAVRSINLTDDGRPWITDQQLEALSDQILRQPHHELLAANQAVHSLFLKAQVDENELTHEPDPSVTLIDFAHPERNQFHAINQFRVDTPGCVKHSSFPISCCS